MNINTFGALILKTMSLLKFGLSYTFSPLKKSNPGYGPASNIHKTLVLILNVLPTVLSFGFLVIVMDLPLRLDICRQE